MELKVEVGDVLDFSADVLISTANPWLNMSGGVNAAICERCPEIQKELHHFLRESGEKAIAAGSVVLTSAGSLPFKHIIHAVSIDPFYDSSVELVGKTISAAFNLALSLEAKSISMPALATGYGPLSIRQFGQALLSQLSAADFRSLCVVLRDSGDADLIDRLTRRGI